MCTSKISCCGCGKTTQKHKVYCRIKSDRLRSVILDNGCLQGSTSTQSWPKPWSPANTTIHLMAVTQESIRSKLPAGGRWGGEGWWCARNSSQRAQLQTPKNPRGAQGRCKVLSGQIFISVSKGFGATKTPKVLNM